MALACATRYRFWTVLAGITAATTVVHLVSVGVGSVVGVNLPTALINVLAGLAFVALGVWTLRGDELTEAEAAKATREGWVGTWVGSTLGMVAADALAIAVGAVLGTRLPEKVVRVGAAVLFFVFGALLVAEGAGILG